MATTFYFLCGPNLRILDREAKVKELINEDSNRWKIPLIEEVFNKGEAASISGMAICPKRQQDQMVWIGTKNEGFSVVLIISKK